MAFIVPCSQLVRWAVWHAGVLEPVGDALEGDDVGVADDPFNLNRPHPGGGSDSTERWRHASTAEVPNELPKRGQHTVAEGASHYPALSFNDAVSRIASRVGVVPDAWLGWAKQAAIGAKTRRGVTTASSRAFDPRPPIDDVS